MADLVLCPKCNALMRPTKHTKNVYVCSGPDHCEFYRVGKALNDLEISTLKMAEQNARLRAHLESRPSSRPSGFMNSADLAQKAGKILRGENDGDPKRSDQRSR